ncbi:MAG: hypothetical protein ACREQJ_02335 [Candidatus Binatia bacterium]
MRFADGKLSVDFRAVPAKEALRAVEKAAKVQIRAPGSILAKILTAKFEDVGLEQGIRRIARNLEVANSAVLYEGDTQIFVLLEKGQSLPLTPTAPGTAAEKGAAPVAAQPKVKPSPEERWQTREERDERRQQTRNQKLEEKIKDLEKRGNSRRAERLRERLSGVRSKPAPQRATPTQVQ